MEKRRGDRRIGLGVWGAAVLRPYMNLLEADKGGSAAVVDRFEYSVEGIRLGVSQYDILVG
jgi:hypothetical protein